MWWETVELPEMVGQEGGEHIVTVEETATHIVGGEEHREVYTYRNIRR